MKCADCTHLDIASAAAGMAPCLADYRLRKLPKTHYMSDGKPRVVAFVQEAIPAMVALDDERPCERFEGVAPHAVKEAP